MTPPPVAGYTDGERRQAAEWFIIVRSELAPSAETLRSWLRWMEMSEGNRLAFEAICETWQKAPVSLEESMPTARELAADGYAGEVPISDWISAQSVSQVMPTGVARRALLSALHLHRTWAVAATLLIASVGLALLETGRWIPWAASATEEFVTKTGEQVQITLNDGSHVWLGARSRLLVSFTKQARGIRLEAGEAFFSVKKDHSRPFKVHAAGGDITAVGTAFDVRAMGGRVTVAVTEGVVSVVPEPAVSALSAQHSAELRVASGQQITMDSLRADQAPTITLSAKVGERARWREGALVYRDEPLRDVVADVSRYSDRRIEIADEAIGDLHFTGVINKSAIDEWAIALRESFPVKTKFEDGRLLIQPL